MLLGLSFWDEDKVCLLLPHSLTGTGTFLSGTGGDATAARRAASSPARWALTLSIFPSVSFQLWALPFSFYQVVKNILDFFNLGGASLSLGNPPCPALCSCLWVLIVHLCSQHWAHTGMRACFPAGFQQGAVSDGPSAPDSYIHGVWAAVYLQRMLLSE